MIRRWWRARRDHRAAERMLWNLHRHCGIPKDVPTLIIEAWLWEVMGNDALAALLRDDAEAVMLEQLQEAADAR